MLTAVAPGRFAASINQAPMRQRTLLWLDYALNALAGPALDGAAARASLAGRSSTPAMTFEEARHLLETTPVARPALFTLVGCTPGERVVIERDGRVARAPTAQDIVVATTGRSRASGWRPRCSRRGDAGREQPQPPRGARRVDGARRGCATWVSGPVLNACTRVSVEMSPATGQLVVAGWEGLWRAATEVTRYDLSSAL